MSGVRADDSLDHESIRRRIVESLTEQGFQVDNRTLTPPENLDKDVVRKLSSPLIADSHAKTRKGLERHQEDLMESFANGTEVDVRAFKPRIVRVLPKTRDELLFRFASLQWSIPVSSGYGRRIRFLVFDESNGKLVGLIGLGDPVFALGPRDSWIGWTREQARSNLHNVLDAFVLGAVQPYSRLLAGKLIALLLASNEVRQAFETKYQGRDSLISHRSGESKLVLATTTSAYGRSSVYNRVKYQEEPVLVPAGYTRGSGEFHFANGLYNDLRRFAELHCTPSAKQDQWGTGFRSRREVIRKALVEVGLPADWLYHGLRRQVFVLPYARNARDYLIGHAKSLDWYDYSADQLSKWFHLRWMIPRSERDSSYLTFDRESVRVWNRPRQTEGKA